MLLQLSMAVLAAHDAAVLMRVIEDVQHFQFKMIWFGILLFGVHLFGII